MVCVVTNNRSQLQPAPLHYRPCPKICTRSTKLTYNQHSPAGCSEATATQHLEGHASGWDMRKIMV